MHTHMHTRMHARTHAYLAVNVNGCKICPAHFSHSSRGKGKPFAFPAYLMRTFQCDFYQFKIPFYCIRYQQIENQWKSE